MGGQQTAMAKELKPVDVATVPGLLSIVEEVRASGVARLIKRDGEDLAILAPVKPPKARAPRGKTKADYEALLAAAGSWADVDTDAFLANVGESRRLSSRPPIEL